MPATYEFLVEDVVAQRFLGALPMQNVSYDDWLGKAGSLSGKVALADADTNAALLDPGRRAIYVRRDGVIEWGGLIMSASVGMGAEEVTVQAKGWLDYWENRDIWTDRQFTATEQFDIFAALVSDAQNPAAVIDPAGTLAGAGASVGISVVYSAPSGVLRDRLEEYRYFKGKNLGRALAELAAASGGFDYAMEYGYTSTAITKAIRLYYPSKGVDRSGSLGFVYERGRKTGVLRRSLGNDASKLAWRVRGWGAGQDIARLRSDQITEAMRGVYPFFDGQGSFSSVVEQATLDQNTSAVLGSVDMIVRMPGLEVDPALPPTWGSYGIGDVMNVRIDDGAFVSSDGPQRVIGYKMDTVRDVATIYVMAA